MRSQYYYLVASLPDLVFSAPAPFARQDLIEDCRRHLTSADAAELDALVCGRLNEVSTGFGRGWLNGERQLRNAVARTRALRLGLDDKKFMKPHPGFRMDAEAAVDDAYSRANPLEREQALDRYRWNLADELSAGDPFGISAVLCYMVKLGINEQRQALTAEAGRKKLEDHVGVVTVDSEELSGWSGLAHL